MPKLIAVQQDIEQIRAAYQPEPCPFCGSHDIELVRRSRIIRCRNCHVEVRPPAWHRMTDAEAMLFWNRCRRQPPAFAGTDLHLVSGEAK